MFVVKVDLSYRLHDMIELCLSKKNKKQKTIKAVARIILYTHLVMFDLKKSKLYF